MTSRISKRTSVTQFASEQDVKGDKEGFADYDEGAKKSRILFNLN